MAPISTTENFHRRRIEEGRVCDWMLAKESLKRAFCFRATSRQSSALIDTKHKPDTQPWKESVQHATVTKYSTTHKYRTTESTQIEPFRFS